MEHLLNAAVTTTATALVLLLLKAVFRNRMPPKLHFCIWIILLIRMMLPVLPQSPVSLFNVLPTVGNIKVMEHPDITGIDPYPADPESGAAYAETGKPDGGEEYLTGDILLGSAGKPFTVRKSIETGILTVWWVGAAMLLLSLSAAYIVFRRRLRLARLSEEDAVVDLLHTCKTEMRIKGDVSVKRYGDTSMLVGLFRPVILLPEGCSGEETRLMLFHELWHLKHRDILWNFLSTIVLCLNWCNPVIWVCYFVFKRDMEVLCDQKVIEITDRKKEYASLLLRASVKSGFPLPMTTCMNHSKKDIKRRIHFMADFRKPNAMWVIAMVLSIALLGAGCLSGGSNPAGKEKYSYSNLNSLLGTEKGEALETLGIDPEKDATTETVGDSQETLTLKKRMKIEPEDATVAVIFYNDILMGFTYQFDSVESGYQYAKQVRQQAEEVYGEPSTLPTLENRLDRLKSADDINVKDPNGPNHYYEEWTIQGEDDVLEKLMGDREFGRFTVNLDLMRLHSDTSIVTFRYAALPKSLNPADQ